MKRTYFGNINSQEKSMRVTSDLNIVQYTRINVNSIFEFALQLKLYAFISAAILISLSSCRKDILDTNSKDKVPAASAFTTPSQILAQVNGLYGLAKNASLYGGGALVWSELHGDEWLNSSQNTGDGAAIYNQNVSASLTQINTLWAAGYAVINNSNILIANLNASTVLLSTTQAQSDSVRNIYIGEAHFLRALAYFNLIQFYALPYADGGGTQAGIPLRLSAVTALTDGNEGLSTVGQIYTQILHDLDSAELVLPVSQLATVNYYRAHKASAIALKTRVYLVKQDYARVITEASKIVLASSPAVGIGYGSGHKLEANIATVFTGSYVGSEAILFFPFNTSDQGVSQAHPDYFFSSTQAVTLNPKYLVHLDSLSVFSTSSGDARNGFISRKGTAAAPIVYFTKYPTKTSLIDYIPAIRYSEVLLNYAEAAARTGDLTNATLLLKAVRKRSNASYVFPDINIATQDSLVSTILHERRIELLGEGFRTFDLLRLVQTIPAKPSIPAVAPTSSQYVWPIPSSEVSTNTFN